MVTILQSLLLGAVQGLTEWLPISSSGHLVIAQKLLGLEIPVAFDTALHMGTLIPVLIIFRREIFKILKAFLSFNRRDENFNLGVFILIGTIVTGLIGITFLQFFESLFKSTFAVGAGLMVSGVFVYVSKFFRGNRKLGLTDSVVIGIVQGVSIAPGMSRSGLTISTGMMRKIDRKTLFRFSFLLSILAIIGAHLVEMRSAAIGNINPTVLLSGVAVSAVVGYAAIKFLYKIILSNKFHLFAYYCFVLGLVIIFLF